MAHFVRHWSFHNVAFTAHGAQKPTPKNRTGTVKYAVGDTIAQRGYLGTEIYSSRPIFNVRSSAPVFCIRRA
jgi:hypothetical protein